MIVKELIALLLDYDMFSEVCVHDEDGNPHSLINISQTEGAVWIELSIDE